MRSLIQQFIYLFRKDRNFCFRLVSLLGFAPGKISYYRTALTHKSATRQHESGQKNHNERLEYLGDAILGAIVAEYLYRKFPGKDEGFMTKLRSRLVKRKHLDNVASKLNLPSYVISHTAPGSTSKHLYGNALEALIGAIYLDQGYRKAAWFFEHKMMKDVDLLQVVKKDSDYKSQLIEWAQKNRKEIVFESYEEHKAQDFSPVFVAFVRLYEQQLGMGHGSSKKEAEQQAAKEALAAIG
ncbi:MAG: ribonuclease III [Bacteroidota bacterium]